MRKDAFDEKCCMSPRYNLLKSKEGKKLVEKQVKERETEWKKSKKKESRKEDDFGELFQDGVETLNRMRTYSAGAKAKK